METTQAKFLLLSSEIQSGCIILIVWSLCPVFTYLTSVYPGDVLATVELGNRRITLICALNRAVWKYCSSGLKVALVALEMQCMQNLLVI